MPLYPRKAAEEGITGWVKLKFDIDKFGNTYNLEVVDANPKNVFDNNAKTAIKDWKFENNKNQKEIFYTMEFVLE
jgi:protein TonB